MITFTDYFSNSTYRSRSKSLQLHGLLFSFQPIFVFDRVNPSEQSSSSSFQSCSISSMPLLRSNSPQQLQCKAVFHSCINWILSQIGQILFLQLLIEFAKFWTIVFLLNLYIDESFIHHSNNYLKIRKFLFAYIYF